MLRQNQNVIRLIIAIIILFQWGLYEAEESSTIMITFFSSPINLPDNYTLTSTEEISTPTPSYHTDYIPPNQVPQYNTYCPDVIPHPTYKDLILMPEDFFITPGIDKFHQDQFRLFMKNPNYNERIARVKHPPGHVVKFIVNATSTKIIHHEMSTRGTYSDDTSSTNFYTRKIDDQTRETQTRQTTTTQFSSSKVTDQTSSEKFDTEKHDDTNLSTPRTTEKGKIRFMFEKFKALLKRRSVKENKKAESIMGGDPFNATDVENIVSGNTRDQTQTTPTHLSKSGVTWHTLSGRSNTARNRLKNLSTPKYKKSSIRVMFESFRGSLIQKAKEEERNKTLLAQSSSTKATTKRVNLKIRTTLNA